MNPNRRSTQIVSLEIITRSCVCSTAGSDQRKVELLGLALRDLNDMGVGLTGRTWNHGEIKQHGEVS